MRIGEGSVTYTILIPIPEVLFEPDRLSDPFRELTQGLLAGSYSRQEAIEKSAQGAHYVTPRVLNPPETRFGKIAGRNSGSWRYWFDNIESQVNENCHYDYPVQFIQFIDHLPEFSVSCESNLLQIEHNQDKLDPRDETVYFGLSREITDTKLSFRIHYYPFGLIAVRFRMYFDSSDMMHLFDIMNLVHDILPDLRISSQILSDYWDRHTTPVWNKIRSYYDIDNESDDLSYDVSSNSPKMSESLYTDILTTLLDSSMYDDFFQRVIPDQDLLTYPIIMPYSVHNPTKEGISMVLTNNRSPSESYIDNRLKGDIGKFLEDNIFLSTSGIFAHTTRFDQISPKNRRRRRLNLLNTLYIGGDLGFFTRKYMPRYRSRLRTIDQEVVDGKFFGAPADVELIRRMDDLILLPEGLRGKSRHIYNLLRDEEAISEYKESLEETTNRLADHDSTFEKILKNLPISFPF
jgi:hypothetical protein